MEENSSLETVARLMSHLQFFSGGPHTLIAVNRQLQLTNSKDLPRLCSVIDKFTIKDINEGLTSQRWNELQGKILTLIHKGVLR